MYRAIHKFFYFFIAFAGVFFVLLFFLAFIDFYPEPITREGGDVDATQQAGETSPVSITLSAELVPVATAEEILPSGRGEESSSALGSGQIRNQNTETDPIALMEESVPQRAKPSRIIIDSIGVDVAIQNPLTRSISVLDDALLRGAVRFPGSGSMEGNGNMFLFGHSSSLPVIRNQNFKAFNNLGKLEEGDTVRVRSATAENIYRVRSVRMDEASNVRVDFTTDKKMLTLATCNSFGSKEDRYIVEADFVGSYAL